MLIHGLIECSRVNGPGRRAVIFLQGCRLGCAGCWNVASHAFEGVEHGADDIAAWLRGCSGIDGATFSGGEPMHQVNEVLRVAAGAEPGLSIGLFSGYTERELTAGRYWTRFAATDSERSELWRVLRARLDFAVLGRYVRARPAEAPLRTSANQALHLFTDRYRESDFAPLEVEVTIGDAGLVHITGFPTAGLPA